MDKSRVAGILAAYSPPLTAEQISQLSTEIAEISKAEIRAAVKKAKRAKRTRKS